MVKNNYTHYYAVWCYLSRAQLPQYETVKIGMDTHVYFHNFVQLGKNLEAQTDRVQVISRLSAATTFRLHGTPNFFILKLLGRVARISHVFKVPNERREADW